MVKRGREGEGRGNIGLGREGKRRGVKRGSDWKERERGRERRTGM